MLSISSSRKIATIDPSSSHLVRHTEDESAHSIFPHKEQAISHTPVLQQSLGSLFGQGAVEEL